jgi:hypothetical protein
MATPERINDLFAKMTEERAAAGARRQAQRRGGAVRAGERRG